MDIGTNSALAMKAWRAGVTHQAELQCFAMEFVSPDDDAPFVLNDDLTRKRGDVIRYRFSPTVDTKDGFGDLDTIEGNEEEAVYTEEEFKIDRLALAYKQRGQMSQQRTDIDLKKMVMVKLGNRWARRFEQWMFNQLCGFTPANYKTDEGAENSNAAGDNYKRTGHNAVTQYDANHYYTFAGETALADEGLDSGDLLTFAVIDEVLEMCQTRTYPITPAADGFYHLFIHPKQLTTLKQSTTTGNWMDLQRALLEGGLPYANSAFRRYFAGEYSNVRIHVSSYVTDGVNSSNAYAAVTTVKRAVLVGANALRIGFGDKYANDDHLDWVEQVRDYTKWGIMADTVGGCHRVLHKLPNSSSKETYGAIVIPTYEA